MRAAIALIVTLILSTHSGRAESVAVGFAEVDITPPVGFRKGGGYEALACPLSAGCGERLVQTAVTMLNELKPEEDK